MRHSASRLSIIDLPFSLGRYEVVQPELAVDLFQSEMNGIIVKVSLRDTVGRNGCREPGDFSLGVSPTAATLSWGVRID